MTRSKVDYDELRTLADEVRRAQTAIADGKQQFGNVTHHHASNSFGNTSAGSTCHHTHAQVSTTMGSLLNFFSGTVDADAERLVLALQLYQQKDAEYADELLTANRNSLDVISTQFSVKGEANDQGIGEHEQAQGEQVRKAGSLAGHDNTVLSGDFNAMPTGDDPAARELAALRQRGFDTDAGDIHDGRGGTSASNKPIDYVMPRGAGSTEAYRWERKDSDHDGQVVDVTIANW